MNIQKLLKQAQDMQKQMQQMQEEAAKKEYEGKSGGGLVTITVTGSGEMKKVSIDPSLIKDDEKEMLEDLIVAAHNDAKQKAEQDSKDNINNAFGDMGKLPPGMFG